MSDIDKAIHAYLLANGPTNIKVLFLVMGSGSTRTGFSKRLERLAHKTQIRNDAGPNQHSVWSAVGPRRIQGVGVPPNQRNVMTAPVLVAVPMQPARHGASDHQRIGSRRGDDLVLHRAPMHMCSGLPGGMK